eukprot:364026-Chlamydomonas_euryale.AAC.2
MLLWARGCEPQRRFLVGGIDPARLEVASRSDASWWGGIDPARLEVASRSDASWWRGIDPARLEVASRSDASWWGGIDPARLPAYHFVCMRQKWDQECLARGRVELRDCLHPYCEPARSLRHIKGSLVVTWLIKLCNYTVDVSAAFVRILCLFQLHLDCDLFCC